MRGRREIADRLARLATGRRIGGWRLTGIDAEGIDLRREGSVARVELPSRAESAEAVANAVERLLATATPPRRKK
jgi:hypothetical protein